MTYTYTYHNAAEKYIQDLYTTWNNTSTSTSTSWNTSASPIYYNWTPDRKIFDENKIKEEDVIKLIEDDE